MFESTPILIYTLFYTIASTCFVLRTNEFVSNGLTVENLLEAIIDKEYNNFIMHHIKRTSYSIVVHSFLPLGRFSLQMCFITYLRCAIVILFNFFLFPVYLFGSLFINDSEELFVNVYFYELCCFALIPIFFSCSVMLKWMSNNWANHPLAIVLSRYNPTDWTAVARSISSEYQRYDCIGSASNRYYFF